ncbi:MAG: TM2 domain-containing protein [Treponema sp.]|nr:TM2 domain-containing protein [Treponema sp.]MCL2251708.1 TM2 domain-containing protein [Treponema sp.]
MYNKFIAYLLWAVGGFGALGLHRFYLRKIPTGILWMLTGGLGMIGSIYDFFTMQSQVDFANYQKAIGNMPKPSDIGSPMRHVTDGQSHIVHEKDTIERIILRIAKENKGTLTVSDLALAANTPIEEARKALDDMVTKGHAELRVRQSGSLVYAIPDILDNDEPLVN